MVCLKGVPTKHIEACLDCFHWYRTFMATDSRTAIFTVARQLAKGIYSTRIRDKRNVRPP